ncbi:MAG: 4-hydroxy-tetrahydrodipicolinate reductase [Oscillospiraceae bacterium]|nr:4-hydroxy-tetrahydrodipicolinate reductase [Oscillospiraceae bacterium]
MTRIILSGCNGKMGRVITACVAERCDCKIVAGFDMNTERHSGYPIYANPSNCQIDADVIIDFSHPSALSGVMAYALEHNLPIVIATTGLTDIQIEDINEMSEKLAIFFSGNMSMGISLITELARKAVTVLGNDFDVEIIEKHHNQKIDAPSGTALMLADAISESLENESKYVFERHSVRQKRSKAEIGISSVRGGTIVGEHEILFAGHDEMISISHTAMSREIFAVGAINASLFLVNRQPGLYSMTDLVREA